MSSPVRFRRYPGRTILSTMSAGRASLSRLSSFRFIVEKVDACGCHKATSSLQLDSHLMG
jgi:hypothetical protein